MIRFYFKLWRGEIKLVHAFWIADVAVWLVCMFFFHLLSKVLSMSSGPVVGMPLGLIFVIYNTVALFGVIRSSRKGGTKKIFGFFAIVISFLLLILSLWVPIYFYGKPLIRL
jgi:hypothetical protein